MMSSGGGGLIALTDPARGAKIVSLRDDRGREWLAQGDGRKHRPGVAFVDAEMAGWDECAPTIVACKVDGRAIPDHGDLWDVPFTAEGPMVWARGRSLDYVLERSITPTPLGLRLTYRAWTPHVSIPFLWAAHPQFVAPSGTRVVADIETVVDVFDPDLPELDWSSELASIDWGPDLADRKVYCAPDRPVSSATLVHPDGSSLTMRWSADTPYLGLWFDRGRYSREPVIAIEPSTGFFDSLATAIKFGRVATLDPETPLTWWIELEARVLAD